MEKEQAESVQQEDNPFNIKLLLELCELYGIEVEENSDNPGFFVRLEDGSFKKLTSDDIKKSMFGENWKEV